MLRRRVWRSVAWLIGMRTFRGIVRSIRCL
jgi:hypothetical protein